MRELVGSGGRVALIIPALRWLFGGIDEAIGHCRRYSRSEIEQKLADAGLTVEHVNYFNLLGVPGFQAKINDRLVPLLRLERRLKPPLGMSLLAVGRAAAS